jgi:hypothetical protein
MYTAKYFNCDIKNIFYIFIEHVDDGIFDNMYYYAISYPNFWTLMFGGNNITMLRDIRIALAKILLREGFIYEGSVVFVNFYYGPKGGARNITSG